MAAISASVTLRRKAKDGEQGPQGEKGEKGEQGADGASAWTLRLADGQTTVSLDTADLTENSAHNFNVDGSTGRTLTLEALYGQTKGKALIATYSATGCTVATTVGASSLTLKNVTGQAVTHNSSAVTDADGLPVYIPVGAASVTVRCTLSATVGGKTIATTAYLTIPILVSYSKDIGRFYYDNTQFTSQLSTLTTSLDEATAQVSAIKQTSDSIKLFVEKSVVKGTNLVRNSLLNAVRTASGWPSDEQARFVTVEGGKTYTLTAWGMAVASGATLTVGAYSDTDSAERASVTITETTRTERSATFKATKTERLRIFWNASGGAVLAEKVQVVEGSEALPWSLSQDDPDANDALFTDADLTINGNTLPDGNANVFTDDDGHTLTTYNYDNSSGTSYKDLIYKSGLFTPSPGTLYTLSFWAKGSGTVHSYLYPSACQGSYGHLTGKAATLSDGQCVTTLSSEWRRVKVTFAAAATISGAKNLIAVRAMAGADVWVAGVKLEKGGRATAYGMGERMLATGIDIRNRRITVTSDQFIVRNNSGVQTAKVNADGVLECDDIVCNGGTFNGVVTANEYLISPVFIEKLYWNGSDSLDGDTTIGDSDGVETIGVNFCVTEKRTHHVFAANYSAKYGASYTDKQTLGFVRAYIPYPCKERVGKVIDICLDSNYDANNGRTAQYFRIQCCPQATASTKCGSDYNGRSDYEWHSYDDEITTNCFDQSQTYASAADYIEVKSASVLKSQRLHVRLVCADGGLAYQWIVMALEQVEKIWM